MATQLRALWILNETKQVVFSRRFPTAQLLSKQSELPDDETISNVLEEKIQQLNIVEQQFDSIHDYFLIFGLSEKIILWPFICIAVADICFLAIPVVPPTEQLPIKTETLLVDQFKKNLSNSPLLQLPCVTGALCVLQDVASSYFKVISQEQEKSTTPSSPNTMNIQAKVAEYMHMYVAQSMPFGRPLDTSPIQMMQLLSKSSAVTSPKEQGASLLKRTPAWKAIPFKGKSKISIVIRETMYSAQYDKPNLVPDVWNAHGCIICNAEVEGYPEVHIQIGSLQRISHLAVHHSVIQHTPEQLQNLSNCKMVVSAPNGAFTLCKYRIVVPSSKKIPLRGFYQMKETSADSVQILIQLKLEEDVRNEFEYCDCVIPMRYPIKSHKLTPSTGVLVFSSDKKSLIWRIGSKFKTQQLEAVMPGKIFLDVPSDKVNNDKVNHQDDPFLVGNNSYVKLNFKVSNYCISGIALEKENISLSTPTKLSSVIIKKEFVSANCKIWNSRQSDIL